MKEIDAGTAELRRNNLTGAEAGTLGFAFA